MKKRLLFIIALVAVMIVGTACGEPAEPTGQNEPEAPAVDVEDLLKSLEFKEDFMLSTMVDVEDRTAEYQWVHESDSDLLDDALGAIFDADDKWYHLRGHGDIYYLIGSDEEDYSLWQFGYFMENEYPYSDVMETIYGIYSAEDIAEIIVSPANMSNTTEGKKLQDEIGTRTITDKKDIKKIYDVISGLTCYIDGDVDMGDASGDGMLNRVRHGRYLTFVTADGLKIDELKYTGISGTFYEYGGIAYNSLTAKEKKKVDEILGIE